MFILPLDSAGALGCISVSLVYEVIRILAAFYLSKPSDELRLLKIQKAETTLEVASIKSVNLEFVRHSLLTRKVIKIEKMIETITADHAPKALKVKNYLRIFRVSLFRVKFEIDYDNRDVLFKGRVETMLVLRLRSRL
jgi:hypothetical protein